MLAVGALLAGCTSAVEVTPAAAVVFSVQIDSVLFGRTYQASAVARDALGREIAGKKVKYESLSPGVASVNDDGLVTPLTIGTANIRASVDGRSAHAAIRVLERAERVVLSPASDQIPIGQNRSFVATVTGPSGNSIAGRLILWRSSNPAVATVNAAGVVSAISRGTTTIRAGLELDGTEGTAAITVVDVPVSTVTLAPAGAQILRVGGTLQATATLRDVTGNTLTGRQITWSSGNPAVVTVSTTGLITAVGLGAANVLAESEGRSAAISLSVTPVPIGRITIPAVDTLFGGDQKQYNPVITDSAGRAVTNFAGRNVSWSSTNIPVATVTPQGIVLASPALSGNADVTMQVDNVTSNVMRVRVAQIASLSVTPSPISMRVGETRQLIVKALGAAGDTLNVPRPLGFSFPVSPALVTVSPTGLITATAAGMVTILVTMQGVQVVIPVVVTITPASP